MEAIVYKINFMKSKKGKEILARKSKMFYVK